MEKLIYRQFEKVVEATPGNTALRFAGKEISYAALNTRSNNIAHYLLRQEQNGTVIMAMPSSDRMVASLLGIFKAGAIYLPIDLAFAEKRIAYILSESPNAAILIAEEQQEQWNALSGTLGLAERSVILYSDSQGLRNMQDSAWTSWDSLGADNPATEQSADADSYIFYTSGSTGTPKAILGIHQSLAQFIEWEAKEFAVTADMRVAQISQYTFDASLRDIFLPLATGATLCIPTQEIRSNISGLLNWIESEAVQLMHTVPSLFQHLTKALLQEGGEKRLASLRHIMLAGEPLFAKYIQRWRETGAAHVEIVNFYGPTETTMIKTFHRIGEVPENPGQILHVGQPMDGAFILVLNRGKLCRIGEIGEVYIKTPFMTRGYYNKPELTAEVFVQNPLLADKEDIIYKTGDLGRYLPDRSLEILGRKDRQVKINGVRIELNEIDEAVLAVGGITETVVKTIKDADDNQQIICYYTGEAEQPELRERLKDQLNEYMLPSYFIYMEHFPLNANGKVDQRALPTPEEVLLGSDFEKPKAGTEAQIAAIWQRELGLSQVGREHTFYQLGGNSLKAMKIAGDIQQEMGVAIKLTDIFVYPSVAQLAAYLDQQAKPVAGLPLTAAPKMESYPLSHTQKRLWILSKVEEASVAYHIPVSYHLPADVQEQVLAEALELIVARHESLRTVFREEGTEPRQVILPVGESNFRLQISDLSDRDQVETEAAMSAFRDRPFDLENKSLLRAGLFTTADGQKTLLLVMHHIISDGWSVRLLLQETLAAYEALAAGKSPALEPLDLQYKDYAVWQQNKAKDADQQESRAYWHKQFEGELPVLEMAADRARPAIKSFNGNLLNAGISAGTLDAFRVLCKEQDVTLFQGLHAVLYTLLSRYTDQQDIIIGTPVANREERATQQMIGFFANSVPLRTQFDLKASVAALLADSKQTTQDAFDHAAYPFDKLVEELGLQRELSRSPLFDVMMVLHRESKEQAAQENTISEADESASSAKFDLTFSFKERQEGLQVKLEYNTDLFDESRIQRMVSHLGTIMEAFAADSSAAPAAIDFRTQEEKAMMQDFGHLDQIPAVPAENLLMQLSKQVQRFPDKKAIYSAIDDSTITYTEFDRQTDRVAAYLISKGVKAGDVIAINSLRHHIGLVAQWGVLKAGAAYVYLESNLPAARRDYIVAHAGISMLLLDDRSEMDTTGIAATLSIQSAIAEGGTAGLPEVSPESLAYIIYTSGSTGEPKGVGITHSNILALLDGIQESVHPCIESTDRFISLASFAFDMTTHDFYVSLTCGASLIIVDQGEGLQVENLEQTYEKYSPTIAALPTAFFNALVDLNFQGFAKLHTVFFGGEAASESHCTKYYEQFDGQIYNGYGPTENTAYTTTYAVPRNLKGTIHIGLVLKHIEALIVDSSMEATPLGYKGELLLSGNQMLNGYYKNEQLNSERFIELAEKRWYRTGDFCKWTENGELSYMGRKDDMLKIRGFLVEVNEIVRALLAEKEVKEASVLPRKEGNDTKLVAYLLTDKDIDLVALKSKLRESLPAYMIPQHFLLLDQMPVNQSGKLDRKALQELPLPSGESQDSFKGHLSTAEQIVAGLWEKILKRTDLDASAHFYELGGDSIKAIQFIAQLRIEGYKLTIKEFMTGPTVAEAARKMQVHRKEAQESTKQAATGKVALSPVISHFFETVEEPYLHHFNQSVKIFHPGGFDKEVLVAVLEALMDHHDILRSRFSKNDAEEWEHIIYETRPSFKLAEHDLRGLPNKEEYFVRYANAIQAGMSLEQGRLMRAGLFREEDGDTLLLAVHHLVTDGVSWRIIFEDLGMLYEQISNGEKPALPPRTDSFRNFVAEQIDYVRSLNGEQDFNYWNRRTQLSWSALTVDHPGHINTVADTASVSFHLSEPETQALQEVAASMDLLEINHVLLAALGMALKEQFGGDYYPVAMEGHGREQLSDTTDLSRTLGWFTSIFPAVLPTAVNGSYIDYVAGIRDAMRLIPMKGASYGMLRYFGGETRELPDPAAQISFNFLGSFEGDISAGQKNQMEVLMGEKGAEVHPLMERFHEMELSGLISSDQLHFSVRYGSRRFERETMERFTQCYEESLRFLLGRLRQWKDKQMTELSFNQQNFYSARRIVGAHSEVGPITLRQLNKQALITAVNALQARHEALRMRVELFEDKPFLVKGEYAIQLYWQDTANAKDHADLLARSRANLQMSTDAQHPWEISVIASPEKVTLTMMFSHLFFDGYSMGLMQKELDVLYQAALEGKAAQLSAPASQYSDFVKAQKRYLSTEQGITDLRFWEKSLSNVNFSSLRPSQFGNVITTVINEGTTETLSTYLADSKISPAAFFLSLLRKTWIGRTANMPIALPVSNRDAKLFGTLNTEDSIGFYSNVLLHTTTAADQEMDLDELLRSTQDQLVEELSHAHMPYEFLMEQLQVPADYQPMLGLNYHNYEYLSELGPEVVRDEISSSETTAGVKAAGWVDIYHFKDGLQIKVLFHPDVADAEKAVAWMSQFMDNLQLTLTSRQDA